MVVITTPAGYGKTTLLSEWVHKSQYIQNQKIHVCWISFDKEEVSIQTFVFLLMSSLVSDCEKLKILSIQSEQAQNQQDWLQILSDIAGLVGPERIVLVMDDYPWTSSEPFQLFLRCLPESFQVVISSRLRPTSSIVRYRLEWQVAELTQRDLRFQDSETLALLEAEANCVIDRKIAEQLAYRTEGWAVALQLATWRIHTGMDPHDVIHEINGNDNLLLEYLICEVYQKQTPEIQRFLRQTSILNRLNPEICDAIREQDDSALILNELCQANVFLSAMDNEHRWYRYHALFVDFLNRKLIDEDGLEAEKHLRLLASNWYEQQKNATRDAANQALLAGDYRRVVNLMERGTHEDVWNTTYPLVLSLLVQVPEKEFMNSPWLSILTTWGLTLLRSTVGEKNNKEWLEIAKTSLINKQNNLDNEPYLCQQMNTEIEILEGLVHCPPFSDLPERIKEKTKNHALAEMVYRIHQSTKYKLIGDYHASMNVLQEGYIASRLKGNQFFSQYFKSLLIYEYVTQGRYVEANALLEEPEEWLDGSASLFCYKAQVLISQGIMAVQKNKLEIAWQFIEQVAEKSPILSQTEKYTFSILKTHYYMGLKEWQNARVELAQALLFARDVSLPWNQFTVQYLYNLVDLRQGLNSRVKQWLNPPVEAGNSHNKVLQMYGLLLRSRCQMALARKNPLNCHDDTQQILEMLSHAINDLDPEHSPLLWTEFRILKGLSFQMIGETEAALKEMAAALQVGAINGYERLFLDEGGQVKDLLLLLAQRRIAYAYCNKLIKSFAQEGSHPVQAGPQSVDQHVVTRREREILFYLAEGQSNNEIADRLIVSLATVKKHLANMYRKIGAASRRQAVRIAREKGWI